MSGLLSQKTVITLLIAVFLVLNIGGAFTASMMMSGERMQDCPFMGIPVLCAMNPVGHVSAWQEMFMATTEQVSAFALLLLFASAVLWYLLQDLFALRGNRIYVRWHREPGRTFEPLQLAFARGIIHSKAY